MLAGPDPAVLLAAGLSAGLLFLLLLGLAAYHLWKQKQRQQKSQNQYQELASTRPSAPGPSAPVIPVSQNSWATCDGPGEIPFQLPPRCPTHPKWSLTEGEGRRTEAQKDILAHRGSLSVSRRFFFFF